MSKQSNQQPIIQSGAHTPATVQTNPPSHKHTHPIALYSLTSYSIITIYASIKPETISMLGYLFKSRSEAKRSGGRILNINQLVNTNRPQNNNQ